MFFLSEGLIANNSNHILRTGSDAELTTPDTHTRTDIETSVVQLVLTKSTLVDGLRDPGDGPHLAVMGMTTKLEIDTGRCCTVQMVGLVVKNNREFGSRKLDVVHQFLHTLAPHVATVVTSDNGKVA